MQLRENLKTKIQSAYCIAGEDSYLKGEALALLRALAGEDMREFNLSELDGANIMVSDILTTFMQVPFMAERRVVVVREFTQNISDDDYDKLLSAIEKTDDAVLVFYYASTPPAFVKKLATFIDCSKLKDGEVKEIAENWCKERGYVVTSSALYKLITYTNCDLMKIKNELEKLFAYCEGDRSISEIDVGDVVSRDIEFVVFALSNAVSDKRAKDAYEILSEARGDVGKNLGMLTTLINQFRRTLHVLLNKTSNKADLARYLGISEYAVSRTLSLANKYKSARLKAITDKFEEVEYLFKSGQIPTVDEALFIGVTYALDNT